MSNYKENDIVSLKLVSGEEVLGKFKSGDNGVITIEKPLVMMHGPQGLAFGNFFATARQENGVSITSNQIIADDLTGDKVKDEYIRVTSNVVQAPKPKIIT
tara:strand:+ start:235 stop:537 length:303 start_codon:yes stop_codon:yes gene_type:complete